MLCVLADTQEIYLLNLNLKENEMRKYLNKKKRNKEKVIPGFCESLCTYIVINFIVII